jgi:hypothetical protein
MTVIQDMEEGCRDIFWDIRSRSLAVETKKPDENSVGLFCRPEFKFHDTSTVISGYLYIGIKTKKKNSVVFSPQANYTDRATAACRRS